MKHFPHTLILYIITLISLCILIYMSVFVLYQKDRSSIEQAPPLDSIQDQIISSVETASESVVSIIITKDLVVYRTDPWGFFRRPLGSVSQKVGGWTGFFISPDGKIITNKHVVSDRDATYTIITNDGQEYTGQVIAMDNIRDIAILQIESQQTFSPLSFIEHTHNISLGQFGIAIGNALAEFENSVSLWVISGKNRILPWLEGSSFLQTDAAINPGNSGGPLLNLEGKVMGINTLIIWESEWIGFAISLTQDEVQNILQNLK